MSADTFGYNSYTQSFTGRIDSSRHSRRASTGNNHIIFFHLSHRFGFINSILFFQFCKQFAEFATAYMEQFAVSKHGRHSLYLQCIYFVLVERTIHHFMRNGRIECCHRIQSLYNIRAVRTSQRNVGNQMYRAFQCFHPIADSLIGEVLPFAVQIQYSQQ